MNITILPGTCPAVEAAVGTAFVLNDKLFMRLVGVACAGGKIAAVNLHNGGVSFLSVSERVLPVSVRLTLKHRLEAS